MKHLLRAMGAAMLAALLLSACSTPQEQTEPSAPQTTQATQAATGATEESATEAEELLALPRDLGSGLTLIIYLYSLGLDPHQLISSAYLATEAVSSIASSIGVILAVPLTAVFTALILDRKKKA